MTVLLFNDRGWDIATAAWSVGAKPGKQVSLCYQWGADGISIFDSATGISKMTLPMTMAQFSAAIASGGSFVDLRPYQS